LSVNDSTFSGLSQFGASLTIVIDHTS